MKTQEKPRVWKPAVNVKCSKTLDTHTRTPQKGWGVAIQSLSLSFFRGGGRRGGSGLARARFTCRAVYFDDKIERQGNMINCRRLQFPTTVYRLRAQVRTAIIIINNQLSVTAKGELFVNGIEKLLRVLSMQIR